MREILLLVLLCSSYGAADTINYDYIMADAKK